MTATTPAAKLGIVNLTAAVMLAFELGNIADQIGRKKGIMRWMPVMGLADELADMEGVTLDQIKAEFKDLDATERAQLNEKIKAKFNLVDDQLEVVIEEAVGAVNDLFNIYLRIKTLLKKPA